MGLCVMSTSEITVPLKRFSVMVERWGFPAIELLVPAFSQEDAIDRIIGEAKQGKYYNCMKAYAPSERGSSRRESNDDSS